ncbi:hypothetical protein CEQ90_05030 [Lewinellaceae bacterium SD302]|nr:hypothetical protein CEQ90_05030 [Lewinellaceae bacterium SD302]
MIDFYRITLSFLLTLSAVSLAGQTVFFQEDFETDGTGTRYVADGQFIDADGSSEDFFGRIENVAGVLTYRGCVDDPIDITNAFTGQSGNFFMAGEDMNDTGGCGAPNSSTPVRSVNFTDINTSGASTITCKILVANGASNGCGTSAARWDQGEGLKVTFSVDNGPFNEGLCFAPDLECNVPGDLTNEPLHLDLNCDGDGEDGFLSNTFTEYSFIIPAGGSELDLSVSINADAGDEEIAFDNIRLEAITPPLPVELADFNLTPTRKSVVLNWTTLTETENDYFSIEYSTDGLDFREINQVKGAGDSRRPINYSWEHNNVVGKTNYYRLRQVDFDGSFAYSKVRSVSMTDKVARLVEVSPNPFSNSLAIRLTGAASVNESTPVQLFNSIGRLVASDLIPSGTDLFNWSLAEEASWLPAGVYLLRIGTGEQAVTKRVVRY